MSELLSIVVHGASGRMGRAVIAAAAARSDVRVVAGLVRDGSRQVGAPLATPSDRSIALAVVDRWSGTADAMIDFSVAAAFDAALARAVHAGIPFVSGTTGLDAAQRLALETAAMRIPVLWSANFSLGVAVLARIVSAAARSLAGWDCEIVEAHHARKRDAPSGTALALGRTVAAARGVDFGAVARTSRDTVEQARVGGEIGFASIRAGDIVGEHAVWFASEGERIELAHRASDRAIFARGALVAARWLQGRPPGLHAMDDVIPASLL